MLGHWMYIHSNNKKMILMRAETHQHSCTDYFICKSEKKVFSNFVYRLHSYIDAERSILVCYSLKTWTLVKPNIISILCDSVSGLLNKKSIKTDCVPYRSLMTALTDKLSKLYTKRWNGKNNNKKITNLDARNGFLMEDSTVKDNKDAARCWRNAFLQQPQSVSVSFNTEMYKGTNGTLTLWANRRWVKDTNNSVNYFFVLLS